MSSLCNWKHKYVIYGMLFLIKHFSITTFFFDFFKNFREVMQSYLYYYRSRHCHVRGQFSLIFSKIKGLSLSHVRGFFIFRGISPVMSGNFLFNKKNNRIIYFFLFYLNFLSIFLLFYFFFLLFFLKNTRTWQCLRVNWRLKYDDNFIFPFPQIAIF